MASLRVLCLIPLLVTAGCIADEDRCSPGQRFEDGACVVVPDGGEADTRKPAVDVDAPADGREGDGAAAEAGVTDATAGDAVATDGVMGDGGTGDGGSGLGDMCKEDKDCAGKAADFCAIQPGQPEGSCTFKDCDMKDPTTCPEGYSCMDLSVFDPSLPTFCNKDA